MRLVELNGEAYFQVAQNKQKPFIVKSGNMLVEAVGTEFNCLSFKNDSIHETFLSEGKVNILSENENGRVLLGSLSPNQMAVFDVQNSTLKVRKVDPEKHIAWKDGRIVFKNDMLADVLLRLERWYNVKFVYDKKMMSDYAFTGSFVGEELKQILNFIELTTPITFEIMKAEKDEDPMYPKTILIKSK